MSVNTSAPRTTAARTGYAIAAAVNAGLLYLVNVRPGWDVVPFLTTDMDRVLAWINVSLVAGLVVNLFYLAWPAPWLVAAGGLVTVGIGLAVLVRLWQVFPFDLATVWTVTMRVVLLLAVVGTIIAVPVQIVSLVRALRNGRGRA